MQHGHSADHDNQWRYRIEAMAYSAADVVRNLGGLLFDRRCLGWDTAVLLNDCADLRPLQIEANRGECPAGQWQRPRYFPLTVAAPPSRPLNLGRSQPESATLR